MCDAMSTPTKNKGMFGGGPGGGGFPPGFPPFMMNPQMMGKMG